jgi:hypothetical protein
MRSTSVLNLTLQLVFPGLTQGGAQLALDPLKLTFIFNEKDRVSLISWKGNFLHQYF